MKFIVIALFIALANAAPQGPNQDIPIISQNSNQEADGSYNWNYETGNGIRAEETGSLKRATSADTNDVIVAQGSYSYTSPEGELIQITYTADDVGGFQAQGAHIPTPPPVPAAIQKALDYILSLPPSQRQGN
ncbi:hypothetical protein PVAND_004957 [Polypedilum vanderplanki]|uniref:Endocuticle structural glycoprotein n=1 Tax=Polypedilum vanderplanki TaxID=319348 RepID=A0A9J6BYF8_POLVA|nr:hypothetical protein PVAND_004957 [Polypedilum vanderplanki]